MKEWLKELGDEIVLEKWHGILEIMVYVGKELIKEEWVILIGSDITKGIVPIDSENRTWRDVCGGVFKIQLHIVMK